MFKNYFLIAWRNLRRNKTFSLISIGGLAIGIAGFIFILLFVINELSYDRFHSDYKNIYRVNTTATTSGMSTDLATSHAPLARALEISYPEIIRTTRLARIGSLRVGLEKDIEQYNEDKFFYADSNFFKVFGFKFLKGNPETALVNPRSLVLTETSARKYFGNQDPLGRQMKVEKDTVFYMVTGVLADVPVNSHIQFDMLGSMSSDKRWNTNRWIDEYVHTYAQLKSNTNVKALEKKMQAIVYTYLAPEIEYHSGLKMADWEKAGSRTGYYLLPLKDIHLRSTSTEELEPTGNISYIYIYSLIAVAILSIAIFNFVNMATSRSVSRAKEVGVRKVIGSTKIRLVYQFIFESIIASVLSTIIAVLLVVLLQSPFESMIGKKIDFSIISGYSGWLLLFALSIAAGILAGFYPAFVLSAFQPSRVLKGAITTGVNSGRLRNIIVVAQFTASIIIIVGTIVVYQQLHFMLTKNLGFSKEQVLVIRRPDMLGGGFESFKNDLLSNQGIQTVAGSNTIPGQPFPRRSYRIKGNPEGFVFQFNHVSYDYLQTMGLKLVSGRFFSKEHGLDTKAVVINEAAAKAFGFKDPIGKELTSAWHKGELLTIIGVVRDFNIESLRKKIDPVAMELRPEDTNPDGFISVKIKNDGNIRNTVQYIKETWLKHANGKLFVSSFLDEDYERLYISEFATGKIFMVFASLSVFVACLGLIGLLMFTVSVRKKEIGVRKVLGASVTNIAQMLSKDFLKLVLLAAVIASPIAWWAMHIWLNDFAYRINIQWWIFVFAGVVAVLIALITVSFHAIKAAMANPVKSLRTE